MPAGSAIRRETGVAQGNGYCGHHVWAWGRLILTLSPLCICVLAFDRMIRGLFFRVLVLDRLSDRLGGGHTL